MKLRKLNIRYQNSPLIDNEKIRIKSPKQGERAPDVPIDSSTRLYQYLRNTEHNILLFAGLKSDKNTFKEIITLQEWLNNTYPNVTKTHIIVKTKINNLENIILDINGFIHEHYHAKNPAIYIIRPDNYIAYYSSHLNAPPIEKFLKRYLYK